MIGKKTVCYMLWIFCLSALIMCAEKAIEKDMIIADNVTIIDAIIANNAQIMNEISVGDDAVIEGTIFVGGDIDAAKDVNVNDNLYVSGDTMVNGNQTLYGTLISEEISTENIVAGDGNFSNVFVDGDLEIANNSIIFGNTSIAGDQTLDGTLFAGGDVSVHGNVVASGIWDSEVDVTTGIPVFVDQQGNLGTLLSSKRFKEHIKNVDLKRIFDLIDTLNIVSFNYKSDKTKQEQMGMIAEQVAENFPEFVTYDNEGKPFSIRYDLLSVLAIGAISQMKSILNDQDIRIERLEMLVNSLTPNI